MRSRWGWALPVGVGLAAVAAKVALSAPQLRAGAALVAITWLVTASYVAVGLALLATDVPPANGWACLVVGLTAVPGDLNSAQYVGAGPWTAVGYVLEPVYLPAAVALALRYPRARLGTDGRSLVAALLVTTVPVRLATVLTRGGSLPDGWYRPPGAAGLDLPLLHDVLVRGGRGVATVLLLASAVALVRRAVLARGVSRQSVIPLTVVGAVAALAAAVDQAIWAADAFRGLPADLVRNLAAAILPVAIMADLLRRRSAVAAVTRQVLGQARSGDLEATGAELRRVLRAPGLALLAPGAGAAADGSVVVRDAEGTALAVLRVDPREVDDEQLLAAACDAARAGLENARLAADLRRRNEELVRSRARIVEAAVAERRRLERDLHDGAQQGFLSVSATLARARLVDDEGLRVVVAEAREGLAAALEELRRLARGIHPAALSQAGLSAALPGLCAGAGARLVLDADLAGRRLPAAVETTAYFVVAEALTNAARHAPSASVEVRVAAGGSVVEVDVADTGPGGAVLRPGGGLTGLVDRVSALGGSLEVHTGDVGTRVTARLPATGSVDSGAVDPPDDAEQEDRA